VFPPRFPTEEGEKALPDTELNFLFEENDISWHDWAVEELDKLGDALDSIQNLQEFSNDFLDPNGELSASISYLKDYLEEWDEFLVNARDEEEEEPDTALSDAVDLVRSETVSKERHNKILLAGAQLAQNLIAETQSRRCGGLEETHPSIQSNTAALRGWASAVLNKIK